MVELIVVLFLKSDTIWKNLNKNEFERMIGELCITFGY